MVTPAPALLLFIILRASTLSFEWDSIIRLTDNPSSQSLGYSYQRSIAIDLTGNVWVLWLDYRSSPEQVWSRKFDWTIGIWLPEEQITSSFVPSNTPSATCDQTGNLHLVWHTEHPLSKGIWYKRYDARQRRWLPDTLLEPTLYQKRFPVVASRPNSDELHIVWCGNPDTAGVPQVFHKEFHPESGWLPAEPVSVFSSHYAATVAVDSTGDLCVVWLGKDFNNLQEQVFCRCRINGVWTDIELVSDFSGSFLQSSPVVAAGRDGNFHIAWEGLNSTTTYRQIFYRLRTPTGFTPVFTVSQGLNLEQGSPSISCRGENECHLVWRGKTEPDSGRYQLIYAFRDRFGRWSQPELLTALPNGDVSRPAIVCDSEHGLHITWQDDSSGNLDIYYLRGQITPSGVNITLDADHLNRRNRPSILSGDALRGLSGTRAFFDPAGKTVQTDRLPPGVYLVKGNSTAITFRKLVILPGGR